ncbi:SAM-dependent methyltransferase [Endozoicomonas sp. OPT23]|uniref:class I SAM-dependent methyltransferase n=1 Tax=Endozoicomonas sp. OPT23 TaxID=2072845 RepID=UPI00129A3AB9|nr:class I SAM-dependent methyltransferase [Endozoicomonas sp. OPT23]MRI33611.1 SAM-dependent methyltransferase [Endozoicomonas sp. OPT23]
MTNSFYDKNAGDFFSSTAQIDASDLYDQFLPYIPKNGLILDAGCGSGRDSLAFKLKNFQVTAFDASHAMSALAQVATGLTIQTCRFDEFISSNQYDGIWACASLLHIPLFNLSNNITHLAQFLKADGVFYCSFKFGDEEVERDGRHFTNLTEDSLASVLIGTPLAIKKSWLSNDLRPGREKEQWLNAILQRKEM